MLLTSSLLMPIVIAPCLLLCVAECLGAVAVCLQLPMLSTTKPLRRLPPSRPFTRQAYVMAEGPC